MVSRGASQRPLNASIRSVVGWEQNRQRQPPVPIFFPSLQIIPPRTAFSLRMVAANDHPHGMHIGDIPAMSPRRRWGLGFGRRQRRCGALIVSRDVVVD